MDANAKSKVNMIKTNAYFKNMKQEHDSKGISRKRIATFVYGLEIVIPSSSSLSKKELEN